MSFLIRLFKNIFSRRNQVHSNLNEEEHTSNSNIIPGIIDEHQVPIINNYITAFKKCRYCYMCNNQNTFICPCKCKGSIKFVHIYCLERWRRIKNNPYKCEICKKKYKILRNNRQVQTYKRYFNRIERDRLLRNTRP